jgi:hypothetical protein
VAPPQSLARLPLRLLCLLVFFFVFLGFFGQLLVYRLPPGPGGRFSCIYPQILYYLVSPCPLISGWPRGGLVLALCVAVHARDGSDLCWRAEEAAPKIRPYVRFWTVVAILLKAVCLSRFPCPLLFFFVVFGYICESCCATAAATLIAVSDHVEIISVLPSEPNLLQQR